ncbi:site-specific integrase [Paenibacillus cisolokensis]|uniref:Site-specific integrase n=1 Tax=Paenibacillus cisolokensis TaxID=1658519 RepID=A0ABQ4N628_9BACL|nr:site-specific integrase [Paenibacillus cisolokensis]GIQ63589.1 site-specific integrase [Paenibacillus cisolokensis]
MGSFRQRGCKCPPDRKRCNCGAKWYYRYDIVDPKTGKRKQKEIGGFTSKAEAEAEAKRIQYELLRGIYTEPSKMTVEEFMTDYVKNTLKNEVAPNTYEQRLAYVQNHIKPHIGKVKLSDLSPSHIQKFYNDLREKYGPGHVQNIGRLLNKAFNQAVRWNMIARNPFQLVKKPSTSRKNTKIKVWTIDEQKIFLSHAMKGPLIYYTLFLLALTSGMRKGEILGLKWDDVDTKSGIVRVKRTIVWAQKSIYLKDAPKTESSIRTIQLPEQTVKALKKWQLACPANELNLVFPSPKTNKILYPNSLDKQFLKTVAESGVSRISFHGLRHTFATTLLSSNVNPKVVQEMLGHATIKTTMDTYSHVLPNMQKEAASQLSAVLF